MPMHNPPHPGEFISAMHLEPNGLSGLELATRLGIAASTLSRVLNGASSISPEMALRLSKALGRSPESWLALQKSYDLWHASRSLRLNHARKTRLTPGDVRIGHEDL